MIEQPIYSGRQSLRNSKLCCPPQNQAAIQGFHVTPGAASNLVVAYNYKKLLTKGVGAAVSPQTNHPLPCCVWWSLWPNRMVWLTWMLLFMSHTLASGNTAPQFKMNTTFSVAEDTPLGAWLFQLVAVDADGDQLTYGMTGAEAYYFSVNSDTGNVTLKQTVDYEKTKLIRVEATVDDQKNAQGFKKLTIMVKDRNDNMPIFLNEPYMTDVLENTTIDSSIYTVLAKDEDTGSAGQVSYTIEEVIPNNETNYQLFYILFNGSVVLNGSLSYNNKSSFYRIKISARDGGGLWDGVIVYQKNTAYLSITVVDVADLDPQFLGEPYVGSVPENSPLGTPVLTVLAIDRDKAVDDVIVYSSVGAHNMFTVNSTTGIIALSGNLDREGVPGEEVQLQVVAREKKLNIYQQVAQVSTTVTIQVTDLNDNTPQFYWCEYPACNFTDFPVSNFSGQIEEHASPRTPVTNLSIVAYDPDKGLNGTFQLSLHGPDAFAFSVTPQQIVNVGTVQVLVSNSSVLDYEKIPNHSVTVEIVANDTRKTTDCCSFAMVTIRLLDINDHRPEFNQSEYKLHVLEESPPGTIVSSGITATDPDSGIYGEITYQLLPDSILFTFTVNASSGTVLVANGSKLEWGSRSVYYATLQAVDGDGLSGSTQLEITVVDINNNAPVVSGSYNVFIPEGQDTVRVQIQATDKDDPETNNGRLMFEIVPGSFSRNFTIDPKTGELISRGPLDREAIPKELGGNMMVTVLVHDLGIPQLNTTVNVTINVEDKNDNAPRFNSSQYVFSVQEGLPGISVGTVEATDTDQTEINYRISFRIESNTGSNNFLILSSRLRAGWYQGNLRLDPDIALDYDRLQQKLFHLTVQAENSDFGGAVDIATALVQVQVLDVNDEPPAIVPSPPNDIRVLENLTLHEWVATLQATDMDTKHLLVFQELGVTCFNRSVNVGNVCHDWFRLEPNGSLVANSSEIDYEVCDQVELKLRVKDKFTQVGDPYSGNETLRIIIGDVNDNPPVFLPITNAFVVIPEISAVNLQVAEVRAADADSGENRVITFAISNVVFISDNGQVQVLENLFKVLTMAEKDLYLGNILVASNLDTSLKGQYQLKVEAKDGGKSPLSSSTSLDIFTVDKSYRVGLQFDTGLPEVQANLGQIKVALTMATKSTIHVVTIKSLENSSTSKSNRATRKMLMEAYFVYSNGSALMYETVITLIQSNTEALSQLLSLGLSIIGPVDVPETNTEKELFGVIAGLAGAVLLILFIMIITLMSIRKSYVRKLKALKALKVASNFSVSAPQQGPAIPGTNKYNTEGNPVLGFSLDPSAPLDFEDTTSYDAVSLNSLDENTVDAPVNSSDTPIKLGRTEARWREDGWEEPLKAALENRSQDSDDKLQPPALPSQKYLSFDNPSLDTTDL
ncbi:cadherin-related family member 2 isoform X2 [Paroedura picta]|uniref:cadherin-related family member 2 isoform X2 n=1 Tax=Paroedura picta TaxID=143630 RepID=UPI00405766EB